MMKWKIGTRKGEKKMVGVVNMAHFHIILFARNTTSRSSFDSFDEIFTFFCFCK